MDIGISQLWENIDGEDISFKIYDSVSETIYDCYETILFEDNATIGSPTDLFELTCGETAIEDILTANERIMLANYPNPFNPETTISFLSPQRTLRTQSLKFIISKGRQLEHSKFHNPKSKIRIV